MKNFLKLITVIAFIVLIYKILCANGIDVLTVFDKFDRSSTSSSVSEETTVPDSDYAYIGNRNNGKLHSIYCDSLPYPENRIYFKSIDDAANAGYTDKHWECMGN